MNRHLLRPVSLALICNLPLSASASINSAAIVASSLSPQCLEYKVLGICYWLMCTTFGCKVRTSTKVRHYVPDAVVSAYSNTGVKPGLRCRCLVHLPRCLKRAMTQPPIMLARTPP